MTLLLQTAFVRHSAVLAVKHRSQDLVRSANLAAPIVRARLRPVAIDAVRQRRRGEHTRRKIAILVIAQLLRPDRREARTSTNSSFGGNCMTSPGVSSGRAVSCRLTMTCDSQGERRWPA